MDSRIGRAVLLFGLGCGPAGHSEALEVQCGTWTDVTEGLVEVGAGEPILIAPNGIGTWGLPLALTTGEEPSGGYLLNVTLTFPDLSTDPLRPAPRSYAYHNAVALWKEFLVPSNEWYSGVWENPVCLFNGQQLVVALVLEDEGEPQAACSFHGVIAADTAQSLSVLGYDPTLSCD